MNLSTLKNQNRQELNSLLEIQDRDILVERFVSLGMPSKKSEEYRYFDVEKLLEKEYRILNYIPKSHRVSDKIEIVDGVVVAGPQGMRIYYEQCGQIDMEHFDPLYYLGHMLSPVAIKIELDGDVEVEIEHLPAIGRFGRQTLSTPTSPSPMTPRRYSRLGRPW